MKKRQHCRRIRKLIATELEFPCERAYRMISEHLSKCEACRAFRARLQKLESILIRSKLQVGELARQSRTRQCQIITREATLSPRRLRRMCPVWVGAAALLLVVIVGASAIFLKGRKGERLSISRLSAPRVTPATVPGASSQTLREMAQVLCRREAPPSSLNIPYTPAVFQYDSFPARLLRRWSHGLGTTQTSRGARDVEGPDNLDVPMTTMTRPGSASSRTVRGLADMLSRYEAPSLPLPYAPAVFWSDMRIHSPTPRHTRNDC